MLETTPEEDVIVRCRVFVRVVDEDVDKDADEDKGFGPRDMVTVMTEDVAGIYTTDRLDEMSYESVADAMS